VALNCAEEPLAMTSAPELATHNLLEELIWKLMKSPAYAAGFAPIKVPCEDPPIIVDVLNSKEVPVAVLAGGL